MSLAGLHVQLDKKLGFGLASSLLAHSDKETVRDRKDLEAKAPNLQMRKSRLRYVTFLKFTVVTQIRTGASRGWSACLHLQSEGASQ